MSSYYEHDDETTLDSRDIREIRNTDEASTYYTEDTMTDDTRTRNDDDTTTTDSVRNRRPRINPIALKEEAKANPTILTEEITNDLRQFINLCEQIKASKEELKILSDLKTELENKISEFMITHDIPAFKTPNGKIQVYQAKTTKPLNKEFLRETIAAKIADAKIVDELINTAFTARPTTSSQKIKVTPSKRDE